MADSIGCCNKSEWELLVIIAEQEIAIFDRLAQLIAANDGTSCLNRTQIVNAACDAVAVTNNALDVNLKTGDIEIGAVEIKNATTDDRATVNASGQLFVLATQSTPASTANRWPVQITDGTDLALVTAAGEQNVLATAQPGVDIGDVTVNNAAGASAVNVQDGGNSLTVDLPAVIGGGYTTFHLVSAATTNATVIKASAGKVGGWYIYNSNAAARKVAFHNTASAPTAGASIFFSLVIPAGSGANLMDVIGINFSTGIAITTVTGLADSDSTAVAANDLVINIWYI